MVHETVQALVNADLPLCVECRRCGHRALVEAPALITPFGLHNYVGMHSVRPHLKCSVCKTRSQVLTSFPRDRLSAGLWLVAEHPRPEHDAGPGDGREAGA